MFIGILGSGRMGGKLGAIFAQAGHQVLFSYARTKGKLKQAARRAGPNAIAGTPADAAGAEAILFAVHWSRVNDVLKQAGNMAGKVIISCMLPMNIANSKLILRKTDSGAEALARKVPEARVVSAFNTVPSEVLLGVFKSKGREPQPSNKSSRPNLIYCGDDYRANSVAARLIRDAGFDPLDAGPLRAARYTEPFALLVAQLAYERPGGPRLAYRFERFKA
jgi:hypothetical protein